MPIKCIDAVALATSLKALQFDFSNLFDFLLFGHFPDSIFLEREHAGIGFSARNCLHENYKQSKHTASVAAFALIDVIFGHWA